MTVSPIHFGTSGWRAIIAEEFTFPNVRLAVTAIAQHVCAQSKKPVLIVAHDTRFFSEEFAACAVEILSAHNIEALLCEGATPTPTVAFEIRRRKTDGAINFTASHNPAAYHGLKFSAANGGPALPEVTRDIEARAAKLVGQSFARSAESHLSAGAVTRIEPREKYLERLAELVRFKEIARSGISIVFDALHGCGAGYLDRALADNGISAQSIRTNRDVLFDGTGPDVSEENLAPLRKAVKAANAALGIATDGDADRFGIVDRDGTWISPNHILALLYDYLVESRGWKLGAGRSVPTSHLIDAVAHMHNLPVYQTPVGFKYVGELIEQDKIALGGEESAGLSIRGHIPEKDGILACLLVAEMTAVREISIGDQLRQLFKRVGVEFWPLRTNLHLTPEVQKRAVERMKSDFAEFIGRRVKERGSHGRFETRIRRRLVGADAPLWNRTVTSRIHRSKFTEASAKIAADTRNWIFDTSTGGRN